MTTIRIALAVWVTFIMIGVISLRIGCRREIRVYWLADVPRHPEVGDKLILGEFSPWLNAENFTIACYRAPLPAEPIELVCVDVIDGGAKFQNSAELVEVLVGPNRGVFYTRLDDPDGEFMVEYNRAFQGLPRNPSPNVY